MNLTFIEIARAYNLLILHAEMHNLVLGHYVTRITGINNNDSKASEPQGLFVKFFYGKNYHTTHL